jgi:SPP1 gp7 family putative phage head morphogenesis protein
MGGILKGRTEDELKRQAGILGKTVKNNAAKAHAIVNGSFHSGTFSDRIWQYQDLMREDLGKVLTDGLIRGKNPRAIAKDMRKVFYGGDPKKVGGYRYCIERLMRTELARVQTEAQKQSFVRNGFGEYTFIVNGGCCDICEGLKGKHFPVEKMMPGENAPPMHPHCRCSTAAYSDRKEYEEWLDFLDKGGTTEEYNKQKKQNVYNSLTNKGTKNSIIEVNRSVGAAGKNYSVKLAEGRQHTKLAPDQKIIGKPFAGKGTESEIREKFRLEADYNIPADKWQKMSGKGYVMLEGKRIKAELHWYEADGEVYEMKVKRYLDES